MYADHNKKIMIPDMLKGLEIPESVAIIMDGNGRYAKKMGIERALGHKAGCEALENILEESVRIGIKYLIVYAFSTENWKRSDTEIQALMALFKLYIPRIEKKATENDVRVRFIGDTLKFDKEIYDLCNYIEDKTKNNKKSNFVIGLNYGGRYDIVNAVNKIIESGDKKLLTEEEFSKYLYTSGIKDPDLFIRTSGEYRLSNFLLWQSAYSEFYFSNKLWPEFGKEDLYDAIIDYNKRDRRYGGRKE